MNVLLLTEVRAEHLLFEESIASLSPDHTFTACESIAEFWMKLTSREIPFPNLIFLDFELSRSYDHELLQILKSNNDLKAAPLVVFADSANLEDIVATYSLQISCFVLVPSDPQLRRRKTEHVFTFGIVTPSFRT